MKMYKISCYSRCGSYFSAYLQSVTVIADNEADAIKRIEDWLEKTGNSFIYPKDKWSVLVLGDADYGVIDYLEDSDY